MNRFSWLRQRIPAFGWRMVAIVLCLLIGLPMSVMAAPAREPAPVMDVPFPAPVLTPTNVTVNRTIPTEPVRPRRADSRVTIEDIFRRCVLAEPLVPVGEMPSAVENAALARALDQFARRADPDDASSLEEFLAAYPASPWCVSLLNNLGDFYRRTGQFSRALEAFQKSWNTSGGLGDAMGRALADQALGQLAELRARVGQSEELGKLLEDAQGRVLAGAATEALSAARRAQWRMKRDPGASFGCGLVALANLKQARGLEDAFNEDFLRRRGRRSGFPLTELNDLAQTQGLDYEPVKLAPGAAFTPAMLPAVVHWKLGHYATVLRQDGGLYLVRDHAFPLGQAWISQDVLFRESSGYFLVPKGSAKSKWTKASREETARIIGRGAAAQQEPRSTGDEDDQEGGDPCDKNHAAMTVYRFHSMLISLHLYDYPVGYTPPVGPSLDFKIMYNQRDANQPVVFDYSNFGPKWTMNLVAYVEDDPATPAGNVKIYRSGGARIYSGFNTLTQTFAHQMQGHDLLRRVADSPVQYERVTPDGGKEIYTASNGVAGPGRKVFLTKIVDPRGNALTLHYDSLRRITAITDAIGQVSTLAYELGDKPYLITRITDPFGRAARFDYSPQGRLVKITDVIGIESGFTYGPGDFVNSLTTPYGTTQFAFGEQATQRWLEATDPYGDKERIEFRDYDVANNNREVPIPNTEAQVPSGISGPALVNTWMSERNTFFWDKKAMKMAPGDYIKAVITHWLIDETINIVSSIKESVKRPYENRVWFTYPGQTQGNKVASGMMASPKTISRVLSDGTTQVYRYAYNDFGQMTNFIDPETRNFTYVYAGNGIDLLEVRQTRGSANDLLQSFTYDTQHRPLTSTDAAGQTTTYTYNAQGQVVTVTNAKGEVTTNTYDAFNRLIQSTADEPGATVSYTYDAYNRLRTTTDSEGYTLTYDYDVLDRITKVTYPDGTYTQTVYDRLDAAAERDREGRWTRKYHNALRQLIAVKDPSGRVINYHWCRCGSLQSLTDGEGNVTRWKYNEAGQMTGKIYADGSAYAFTYDNANRLATRTDALGQVTTYAYFKDNNLKSRAYSNTVNPTPNVSFTYAQQYNRLTSMADGSGTTTNGVTTYAYHPLGGTPVLGAGQLQEVNGSLSSDLVQFNYDELGRVRERRVNGNVVTYGYDNLGRLTQTTNALGAFTYAYVNQTPKLAGVNYPNGQTTTYDYYPNVTATSSTGNGDRRLKQIVNKKGATNYSQFDYRYEVDGNINQWTKTLGTNNPVEAAFTYDPVDRLTGATYQDGSAVLAQYGYTYDKADNRTTERLDDVLTTGAHNNLNQLTALSGGGVVNFSGTTSEEADVTVGSQPARTSQVGTSFEKAVPLVSGTNTVTITAEDPSGNTTSQDYEIVVNGGSAQSFTYDANGNMTGDGVRAYAWDAENRLIKITEGAKTTDIEYDGLHHWTRLLEKDSGTTTSDRRFIWVNNTLVEQRNRTSTTAAQRYFPRGLQQGSNKFFYTRDHLGSIREVMDNSGTVVACYDYNPYGRRAKLSGSFDSDFGFTGHYCHAPSGLHFAPFRGYSAELGRWISRDPVESIIGEMAEILPEGSNLYAYVLNNPVRWNDPEGLIIPGDPDPTDEILIIIACKRLYDLYKASKGAKRAVELAKHLKKMRDANKSLADLKRKCPKGKKDQDEWQAKIKKLENEIKGHKKEISQKWPEALDKDGNETCPQ